MAKSGVRCVQYRRCSHGSMSRRWSRENALRSLVTEINSMPLSLSFARAERRSNGVSERRRVDRHPGRPGTASTIVAEAPTVELQPVALKRPESTNPGAVERPGFVDSFRLVLPTRFELVSPE